MRDNWLDSIAKSRKGRINFLLSIIPSSNFGTRHLIFSTTVDEERLGLAINNSFVNDYLTNTFDRRELIHGV